ERRPRSSSATPALRPSVSRRATEEVPKRIDSLFDVRAEQRVAFFSFDSSWHCGPRANVRNDHHALARLEPLSSPRYGGLVRLVHHWQLRDDNHERASASP